MPSGIAGQWKSTMTPRTRGCDLHPEADIRTPPHNVQNASMLRGVKMDRIQEYASFFLTFLRNVSIITTCCLTSVPCPQERAENKRCCLPPTFVLLAACNRQTRFPGISPRLAWHKGYQRSDTSAVQLLLVVRSEEPECGAVSGQHQPTTIPN